MALWARLQGREYHNIAHAVVHGPRYRQLFRSRGAAVPCMTFRLNVCFLELINAC